MKSSKQNDQRLLKISAIEFMTKRIAANSTNNRGSTISSAQINRAIRIMDMIKDIIPVYHLMDNCQAPSAIIYG